MTQQDRLRRQQLVGRLKASIATAAVVATFGGWAAFGMQQPATATDSTVAVSPTATAVSQTSQSGITPSAPSEQSDNSTTEVVPSSSSRSFLQRRPVTSTRSSR